MNYYRLLLLMIAREKKVEKEHLLDYGEKFMFETVKNPHFSEYSRMKNRKVKVH